MVRFVVVEGGKVSNITVGSSAIGNSRGWIQSDSGNIGDTYDKGVFTPPPQAEAKSEVTASMLYDALVVKGVLIPDDVNPTKKVK